MVLNRIASRSPVGARSGCTSPECTTVTSSEDTTGSLGAPEVIPTLEVQPVVRDSRIKSIRTQVDSSPRSEQDKRRDLEGLEGKSKEAKTGKAEEVMTRCGVPGQDSRRAECSPVNSSESLATSTQANQDNKEDSQVKRAEDSDQETEDPRSKISTSR